VPARRPIEAADAVDRSRPVDGWNAGQGSGLPIGEALTPSTRLAFPRVNWRRFACFQVYPEFGVAHLRVPFEGRRSQGFESPLAPPLSLIWLHGIAGASHAASVVTTPRPAAFRMDSSILACTFSKP
jgi:hypothetical protein